MKLLSMMFVLTLSIAANGQNTFEWNEYIKITEKDFKGSPPDPSSHQTLLISFELNLDLDSASTKNLKSFNNRITNLFNRDNSWIDWTDTSRLRYAIALFDLKEWMTRELRKKLKENAALSSPQRHEKILEELRKEFEKLHMEYDRESESGNNLDVQVQWETKIAEHLTLLADYCKMCDPN